MDDKRGATLGNKPITHGSQRVKTPEMIYLSGT